MKPDEKVKNELYRKLENQYEPVRKTAPPIIKWLPMTAAVCLIITASAIIYPRLGITEYDDLITPADEYEENIITTEPPATTTEPPVTTTELPVTTTEPPDTTTEPPVTTTEPPVTTTEPPVTTTEPSVTTTEPPVTTTEPPVTTTTPPVTTTTPPIITTPEPIINPNIPAVDLPYNMHFDPNLPNMVGPNGITAVLKQSGDGKRIVSQGMITISDRNGSWYGVDIMLDALNFTPGNSYNFIVTGMIVYRDSPGQSAQTQQAEICLIDYGDIYNGIMRSPGITSGTENFMFDWVISYDALRDLINTGQNYRIATTPGTWGDLVITGIVITAI
jgi:hypothetical protein